MDFDNNEQFTIGEEIANSVIHGIGALLSIAALAVLTAAAARYGSVWHVASFAVFGSSMVLLYTFSAIYHGLTNLRAKRVFEFLDHSGVFLLIAGTYTPFSLVALHGRVGWTIFGVIWGLFAAGIIYKAFFLKKAVIFSTLLYVCMGWVIVLAFKPLLQSLAGQGVFWLVLGGVLYTAGTVFYVRRRMRYHHALWHLFVLAGTGCHFICVLFYVLPIRV